MNNTKELTGGKVKSAATIKKPPTIGEEITAACMAIPSYRQRIERQQYEQQQHRLGRRAAVFGQPRDPAQSELWLAGYDGAVNEAAINILAAFHAGYQTDGSIPEPAPNAGMIRRLVAAAAHYGRSKRPPPSPPGSADQAAHHRRDASGASQGTR
jgi:hypothetical protein